MRIGKWIVNVLIGVDQLGNALWGGDPDESVSSRIGKMKLYYKGRIPWYHFFFKVIDWGLNKIDPNHSIDAIEHDEGKDAVIEDIKK